MRETGATENNSARDVDVIAGRDEVADDVKKLRHGFAGKNVARKENAGKKSEEGELNGFGLRVGFAGNENADGKSDEEVWQGKEPEQQHISVDRNLKHEAHKSDDGAQLCKSDDQV